MLSFFGGGIHFANFQAYWCKPPDFGTLHMLQAGVLIGCRLQVSEVQVLYSLGGLHAQRVIGPHHQSIQTAEVSCSLHVQEKFGQPMWSERLSSPSANLCSKKAFQPKRKPMQ